MIGRLLIAALVFIIITIMLILLYGWALIKTFGWEPYALFAAYDEYGFLKQYAPVVECIKYGPRGIV